MIAIDITETDLDALGTVALRKLARDLGFKGVSSARGAALREILLPVKNAQHAEKLAAKAQAEADDKAIQAANVATAPKKGVCEDCGRKVNKKVHPTLCPPCFDYAGWENTHSDEGHSLETVQTEGNDCPVCHPELDPRTAPRTGKSRAGMVIIAKGSEIHKSTIFKTAAESKGWSVQVTVTVLEAEEDGETFELELHTAIASRGQDMIVLKWNGRAYDYPNSGAKLNGKIRKVRNLKEALRLI